MAIAARGPDSILSRSARTPDQFDGADYECDGHRDRCDGEVVEDFAYRLGEIPAVGVVHEDAIGGVHQAHAGRKEDGQDQDCVERQVECGRASGEFEESDFGRRVEAESEQHADRVDVSGLGDRLGEAAEEAVHEPA